MKIFIFMFFLSLCFCLISCKKISDQAYSNLFEIDEAMIQKGAKIKGGHGIALHLKAIDFEKLKFSFKKAGFKKWYPFKRCTLGIRSEKYHLKGNINSKATYSVRGESYHGLCPVIFYDPDSKQLLLLLADAVGG